MRYTLFLLLAVLFSEASGQNGYWQQAVSYEMNIDVFEKKHQYIGNQTAVYTNNSPDTLKEIFYHLYFNAFQPGSMMDVRSRNIQDPDPRVNDRILHLHESEWGYIHVLNIQQDGMDLEMQLSETILKVILNEPLAPGKSTKLWMEFEAQVPRQIRRSGWMNKEGIEFSMSQWYPKICEYDKDGWHANPYVGREFHGVWGDFDVKITIDSSYVLGGTGVVQNPEEVKHGYGGYNGSVNSERLTWHFKAENVHDFMWAADPDYVHMTHPGPNGMEFHFLVQPDTTYFENWKQLPEQTAEAFSFMNEHFGLYAYPQYSVIQGGDGGMEYPMGTLITGKRALNSLVGVTVHELIHSWYQGMLATNEAKYAWMDEGFTTFASELVMAHLQNREPNFSNFGVGYTRLVKSGAQEPLTTHADHFSTNFAYGTSAYTMGALVPIQLMHIIGTETLLEGMKEYHRLWSYKHPEPRDFKRVMEKHSGIELDWFFEQWIGTLKHIDYAVADVQKSKGNWNISLKNEGDFAMPVSVEVRFENGTQKRYFIPLSIMQGSRPMQNGETLLDPWAWTHPEFTLSIPKKEGKISQVRIFPNGLVPDVEASNNTWEPAKK